MMNCRTENTGMIAGLGKVRNSNDLLIWYNYYDNIKVFKGLQ